MKVSENLASMADLPVELARFKKIKVKTKQPHTGTPANQSGLYVVHTAKLPIGDKRTRRYR